MSGRDGLDTKAAAACYPCRRLYEAGGPACDACHAPLTRLDADDNWIFGLDVAKTRRDCSERLLDDALNELHWNRVHPRPPFPTDSMPTFPSGWNPVTAQSQAYEAWIRGLLHTWAERRPAALADAALVAEAERVIAPKVDTATLKMLLGNRRYRCPACSQFALEAYTVPFPM